ncbi:MAG: DUF4391 domain-containing protein [Tissierellia bacterium]|nr:DUF4391 domain-containing protein [Tissierellia bacterium]
MTENLYEKLFIPKKARLKTRIPFNQIFKAMNINLKEQKELANNINKIYLIGEINSINCNYQIYKNEYYLYETIQYLYIELSKKENLEMIDDIFHRLLPNPIIIIYSFNDKPAYSTSLKRLNKVENDKIVVENIYNTTFNIDEYFYKKLKEIMNAKGIINLFELYKEIDDIIYLQMLYQITNKFKYNISINRIKNIYKEINLIEKENKNIQSIYNNEKNQAKRMDLYMAIKQNKVIIEEKVKEIEN